MKFTATLLLAGKTATGIEVPAEVVDALAAGRRPKVSVTIKSHTYRSSIAVMSGVYMLPVSEEHRLAAGIAAGDELSVEVELDNEPREVSVPADFAAALAEDSAALAAFDRLAYSHKLRHVLAIDGAKTAETRQRRISNAIETLRAGR